MQIIKKMESQNGGVAPSRRDTKREWANNSAMSLFPTKKTLPPTGSNHVDTACAMAD